MSETECPQRRCETGKFSLGRTLSAYAYQGIPSFRREDGGLYDVYVAVYSRVYRLRMSSLHKRGRHSRPMDNGRCTWCGARCKT